SWRIRAILMTHLARKFHQVKPLRSALKRTSLPPSLSSGTIVTSTLACPCRQMTVCRSLSCSSEKLLFTVSAWSPDSRNICTTESVALGGSLNIDGHDIFRTPRQSKITQDGMDGTACARVGTNVHHWESI